jgi:hypothetical protein
MPRGLVWWLVNSSWTAWPLNMGQIDCPETSVTNCQRTLRNIPEGPRSQLCCSWSPSSRLQLFSNNFVAGCFVNFPASERLLLDNAIVKVRLGVFSMIPLSRSRKRNTKLTQRCETYMQTQELYVLLISNI